MPGVEVVAISDTVPPSGFVHSKPLQSVQVAGHPAPERRPGGIVAWRRVSPEYFSALGIPMLQGRSFRQQETTGKSPAVVISNSLARKMFPGERAISRAVHLYVDPLDFPPPIVIGVCIVRGSARPDAIANWIRTSAAALDRTVPVTIATMQQRMHAVSERPRSPLCCSASSR
jgi:putative ABC transport system permease protein